jgi:hypothetical protein
MKLKQAIPLFGLIVFGSLTWVLTMVKSGLCWGGNCANGIGFWGPHGHDGVWHIALARSLARGSWEMPVFAGEPLANYHFGFNLLLAMIHKLTTIPVSFLYFQILPPVIAIAIGYFTYKFVKAWKGRSAALWSLFFVYFSGSFGWVVNIARGQPPAGESMFWSQQAISTLVNPPFALSLVLLVWGLYLLEKHLKTGSKKGLFLASMLFGISTIIKVYAGLLIVTALAVAGFYRMIAERKGISVFKVFSGTLLVSILVFAPLNSGSGSMVVFVPFWFLETMMGLSDRLDWPRFYEAMTNYRSGGIYHKTVAAYISSFAIFTAGNMGTRLLALPAFVNYIKRPFRLKTIEVVLSTIIAAGVVTPMLFLQEGTPWNTIQFFYYSLFFLSILAGITVSRLLSRIRITVLRSILTLSVVLLTVPTTIGTLYYHYLPGRPPAMISNDELEALKFLEELPEGVVLTYPYDEDLAREAIKNPPRPLYLYVSTSYVSAYSNKPVFLEDEVNLDITGYDWPSRRRSVEEFLQSHDDTLVRKFLLVNNIEYVYWLKGQRAVKGEGQLGMRRVFENKTVEIYQVSP